MGENKKLTPNPQTAPVVREIFTRYANGESVKSITDDLNHRGIKSSRGSAFNKNSLHTLLKNKKYIGVYTYNGTETDGGTPRLISDTLFAEVQYRMEKYKHSPSSAKSSSDFILTTKLFCGHCREMMIGVSGTSRSGGKYQYYTCKAARRKSCNKTPVRKDVIENAVISKCRELLTDENINAIAAACMKIQKTESKNTRLQALKKQLRETETAVENLYKALERGDLSEELTARIKDKTADIKRLQAEIQDETAVPALTDNKIKFFLKSIRDGSADDEKSRRALIAVFVNAIYLYDDKFTLFLNIGGSPVNVDGALLDKVENAGGGSSILSDGVPKQRSTEWVLLCFSGQSLPN